MAGIDPGSETGIVFLDVPDSLDFRGARWLDSCTIRPSRAAWMTEVDRDQSVWTGIRSGLGAAQVEQVAIECPAEAKVIWRGNRRQRTETAFRSGVYYALAMTAAWDWGTTVASYPATTTKKRGVGWMGKSPRHVIVTRLRALLASVGAPEEVQAMTPSGDELRQHHLADALGVLAYYVNDQRLLRAAS